MEQTNVLLNDSKRGDIVYVDPRVIYPKPNFNPRKHFDREKLDELKQSVREIGVKNPIRCEREKLSDEERAEKGYLADQLGFTYFLTNGERRTIVAKEIVAEDAESPLKIPVILESKGSNEVTRLVDALVTNMGEPLTQLETAYAYKRLIDYNMSVGEIASKVGKKDSYVSMTLSILELPQPIIEKIKNNEISVQVALGVRKVAQTKDEQIAIVDKAIEKKKTAVASGEKQTKAKNATKVTLGDVAELTNQKNLGATNSVFGMLFAKAEKIGNTSPFYNLLSEFHALLNEGVEVIDAFNEVDKLLNKKEYKEVG